MVGRGRHRRARGQPGLPRRGRVPAGPWSTWRGSPGPGFRSGRSTRSPRHRASTSRSAAPAASRRSGIAPPGHAWSRRRGCEPRSFRPRRAGGADQRHRGQQRLAGGRRAGRRRARTRLSCSRRTAGPGGPLTAPPRSRRLAPSRARRRLTARATSSSARGPWAAARSRPPGGRPGWASGTAAADARKGALDGKGGTRRMFAVTAGSFGFVAIGQHNGLPAAWTSAGRPARGG